MINTPHSIEAEYSVLGSMFIDPEDSQMIIESLINEDFHVPKHREIFKACSKISQDGNVIELLSVGEKLPKYQGFLMELMTNVVSSANLETHIKIVKEKASLRKMVKIGNSLLKDCYENEKNFSTILENVETELFSVSKEVYDQGLKRVGKVSHEAKEIQTKKQNGEIVGIPTGFRDIDTHIGGLQPTDLVVLAARPAMGKTAFALNLAEKVSRKGSVAFFSLEMSSYQLFNRLVSFVGGIDSNNIRNGSLNKTDFDKYLTVCDKIPNKLFIDDTGHKTINQISSQCRRLSSREGLDLVVIDYIGLMDYPMSYDGDDNRGLGYISRKLKGLAKELNCTVLVLSQLNRNCETRTDKRPLLADLRSSGAIEQDADQVFMLYRPWVYDKNKDEQEAEFLIRKFRNGSPGEKKLRFIGSKTKFEDWNLTESFRK